MLKSLQIENYAIIQSLNIDFESGFSVITGETGAGKSILLGALSLILGNRAETDILFDKSKKCIVEAVFDIENPQLELFFSENDLDFSKETTIRREINEHGKSRAFVNDTPVNLNTLKIITSQLIDVHSQHKNLMLQNADFRLSLIDQFAQNSKISAEYKNILHEWKKLKEKFFELKRQCEEDAFKNDYNLFAINELDSANLQIQEQEEIEEKIRELQNAEEIKNRLFNSINTLSEFENGNILQFLNNIHSEFKNLVQLGEVYENFNARIESLISEIQDLSYEMAKKNDQIEINPGELDRLNERIDLIYTLQNKYHAENNESLLNLLQELKETTATYSDNKELLAEYEQKVKELEVKLQKLAQNLSESRKNSISTFVDAVEERLHLLGMSESKFGVELQPTEEFRENGRDSATFLFSANRGVAPADLAKTASGGELSRIMLCLKSIITDSLVLPTIIFDEIDSGISGEAANRVGAVMSKLAENHQVISITHLPQIAARGKNHYFVFKQIVDDRTATGIRRLSNSERENAIAEMLSGSESTDAALSTAREMLYNTKNIK